MIHLQDGPAAGVALSLRRAPKFLRVVRGRLGDWDGLDQLDDEPKKTETIAVYRRQAEPTYWHLDRHKRGNFMGGPQLVCAEYRWLANPPADAVLRSTSAWQQWCLNNERTAI